MEVADGVADQLIEQRMLRRGRIWRVTADEAPQHLGIFRVRGAGKIEEQREADWELGLWRRALMNVPHRVHQFRGRIFFGIRREMPDIFVDRPRDYIEIE